MNDEHALDVWLQGEMFPFESDEPRVRGRWINGVAHRGRDEPTFSEWEIERAGVQDCHPYYEVAYVIEGELFVESGGRTVRLQPGEAVRVRPGHIGRYWAPVYARIFGVDGPNPDALPSSDFDYWEIDVV
jgi:uncharacterized cupin superfamily protein